MTPQELKNSILQLAIQGKLVEQRPEEGTAEELYRQIQAEKQRRIEEGTIKRKTPLLEITEDEKPFDIPETWLWIRFGCAIDLLSGQDLRPFEYNDIQEGMPYITGASNIDDSGILVNRWTECARAVACKGALLLTCKGTVGKTAILNEDKVHVARQIMSITPFIVDTQYVKCFVESQVNYLKSQAKSMIPGIERNDVLNLSFPLPPLAEQKRIVAKIEELLPYIDRYEQAWNELENLDKRFPGDVQKAILQMAIQGRLVEQRPEEGTGEELYQQIQAEKQRLIESGAITKDKPLPEIAGDEKPFDIPESWKWVRVIDVAFLNSGNQHDECPDGALYIKVADMNLPENQYEICTSTRRACVKAADLIPVGSIIFPKRGGAIATNKKRLVLREPICTDSNTMAMTIINGTILPYLSMWFRSIDLGKLATGTSVPQINNKDIYPLLVPLPPLAEQKRIVAKLDALLPLCKNLK